MQSENKQSETGCISLVNYLQDISSECKDDVGPESGDSATNW